MSATIKKLIWLVAAFIISFLAVGIPYWQVPYAKVSLPNTLYGVGLVVVALAALTTRWFGEVRLWLVILVLALSVPATVMARVAVEVVKDPTSHNLWPFEVALALGTGGFCSLSGALAGSLPGLLRKQTGENV